MFAIFKTEQLDGADVRRVLCSSVNGDPVFFLVDKAIRIRKWKTKGGAERIAAGFPGAVVDDFHAGMLADL